MAADAQKRARELLAQTGDAAETVRDYGIATYRWARAGFQPAGDTDQQRLPDTTEDAPNTGERE